MESLFAHSSDALSSSAPEPRATSLHASTAIDGASTPIDRQHGIGGSHDPASVETQHAPLHPEQQPFITQQDVHVKLMHPLALTGTHEAHFNPTKIFYCPSSC